MVALGHSAAPLVDGAAGMGVSLVDWDPRDLAVPFVAQLRAALVASDREAFASRLTYPVRVNTVSRCTAQIDSASVFVSYFDPIVKGRVEAAILSSKPPFSMNWQGVSLDRGSVWLDLVAPSMTVAVTAFNSDAWRLGVLPCLGEPERRLPTELSGGWRVTSIAILQGGQLVPRSPAAWIGRRIELDLNVRRAVLDLGRGPAWRCAVGRSAEWDPGNSRALGAPRAGLAAPDRPAFIDLECGSGRERQIARLDILSVSALALVGDDKYLLVLKRESRGATRRPRLLKVGEPCGGLPDRCPRGQVCTATRGRSDELVETCREID